MRMDASRADIEVGSVSPKFKQAAPEQPWCELSVGVLSCLHHRTAELECIVTGRPHYWIAVSDACGGSQLL
jgi:hypothetical protein